MAKATTERRPRETRELTIGEVADQAGLRTSAVRYYESVGVLPVSKRVNGRRVFGPEIVRLLRTVRFAQQAGFTVAEIRTLFHGFGANVPPSARWRQLADRKLVELDALVAQAERMRQALRAAMQCGCLRIEDCEFNPDNGYALPERVNQRTPRGRRSRE